MGILMNLQPIREPHESDYSFCCRVRVHRDLTAFEDCAAKKLIAWKLQNEVRMHLDADIEVDRGGQRAGSGRPVARGVWVPVQVLVSFEESDVDPENWLSDGAES